MPQTDNLRLPPWLRRKTRFSSLHVMQSRVNSHGLSTVCEEARCPNRAECYMRPTATFMILGDSCTRNCSFCGVSHAASALAPPAQDEPERVASLALELGLRFVVITSVTRDDLPDGGALQFARTIRSVRSAIPGVSVEVLVPDFGGDAGALGTVIEAGPDVFNHNVETVPSLYPVVRPQADYRRSLRVLEQASHAGMAVKSGMMLGLGEGMDEVVSTMADLRGAGVGILTLGQYMRPSRKNIQVHQYIEPAIFDKLGRTAREMGFCHVASAPLVRSSMHAEDMFNHTTGD